MISLKGRLVASLVAEFLQFFNLDFTLAVFQPESSTVSTFNIFISTLYSDIVLVQWNLNSFLNLISMLCIAVLAYPEWEYSHAHYRLYVGEV